MARFLAGFLALAGALVLCIGAIPVQAQTTYSQTVTACGTPNNTAVVGNTYPDTMDPQGRRCVDDTVTATIASLGATSTAASGTVAAGGTFQSIIAASGSRLGCLIENPTTATEPLYVFFGANGSATTGNSVSLAPGGSVACSTGLVVLQDNISVTAATTSHAFTAFRQ